MKTLNTKQIIIAVMAAAIVLSFVTLAVIHIVNLTNAGLIDWKN
jgi:hypothetical protein